MRVRSPVERLREMECVRVVMLNDRGGCVAVSGEGNSFILIAIEKGRVTIADELRGALSREGSVETLDVGSGGQITAKIVELAASRVRALDWVRLVNSPQRVQYASGHP